MEPQTVRSPNQTRDRPRGAGLPRERERLLARLIAQGDPKAEEELVRANLAFVFSIAGRYRNFGVAREDLVNEGTLGLIEAARRFDPRKNTRFVTYAYWWIRRSILHALRQNHGQIRVPENRLREARRERAEREAGRSTIETPLPTTISLDHLHVEDRGLTLHERLADGRPAVDDEMVRHETWTQVGDALDLLTERERFVIVRRYGIDRQRLLTLRQLGRHLGLTGERVRQIETDAKRKLRSHLDRCGSADQRTPSSARVFPGTS